MAERTREGRDWAKRYPPLLGGLCAVLLAVLVLPSALHVPQTNPPQTLEYAPVPPTAQSSRSAAGNLSDLGQLGLGGAGEGLGQSSPSTTLAAGVTIPPLPPLIPGGLGTEPVTKDCVGDPPRQTEDPLSPPCVAYFEGDNGGATATGVSGTQIRILWMINSGTTIETSRGAEASPPDGVYDVNNPNYTYLWFRMLRLAETYFNARYQLYGREAHFYLQVGGTYQDTPEERHAEAVLGLQEGNPFIVVDAAAGDTEAYVEPFVAAHRTVFIEASVGEDQLELGEPASFYQEYPGLVYSFGPSVDQRAAQMADYVCSVAAHSPVDFSGVPGANGKPRKFGVVELGDPTEYPNYAAWDSDIEHALTTCGANYVTGRSTQICYDETGNACPNEALDLQAKFRSEGVTTELMADDGDTSELDSASELGFLPEFIFLGDGYSEDTLNAQGDFETNKLSWPYVRAVTNQTLSPADPDNRYCVIAAREADPDAAYQDVRLFWCIVYPTLREVFSGIQVGGAHLTSEAIDEGFHAIPAVRSTDPQVQACFYLPNDYSCVKDLTVAWFDPNGTTPGDPEPEGCYRMMGGGARFLPGTWTDADVDSRKRPSDPCSLLGPPSPTPLPSS